MLRLFPKPQDQEDELAIGKARFKVAALQAMPTDMIRRHPLSTFFGTTAIAIAIGALLGGRRSAPAHNGHAHAAAPAAPKSSWFGPLITMGSNLLQAYITKQMAAAHHASAEQTTAAAAATERAAGM
jgi:hypothetical protein